MDHRASDYGPLSRGDQVPHFTVRTLDGHIVDYRTIWQHRQLVLVSLGETADGSTYATALGARDPDLAPQSACVITHDQVPGLPAPGVLVADRWGEIVFAASATRASDLPPASDLIEWLEFIGRRC